MIHVLTYGNIIFIYIIIIYLFIILIHSFKFTGMHTFTFMFFHIRTFEGLDVSKVPSTYMCTFFLFISHTLSSSQLTKIPAHF